MMRWAIVAAVVAVIAGALGFGLIASAVAAVAKIFFFLFLFLFVVLSVSALVVGRKVKSAFSDKTADNPKH